MFNLKGIFSMVVVALMLSGCAGVELLGTHSTLDGGVREYISITTDLEYGPAMRIVEGIKYDMTVNEDGTVTFTNPTIDSRYSAGGDGLLNSLVSQTLPVATGAGLGIAAARARRPSKTNVTTNVQQSGSIAVAEGGSSESESGSYSASESYSEGSYSESNNTNTNVNENTNENVNEIGIGIEIGIDVQAEGGSGCPGNSCGQGGNGPE